MKKLTKEDFSYVVSSITGFTDQGSTELITESLVGGQTIKYLTPRTGIKGTQTINVLDSTPTFADGACGWSAAGTTTLSQVDLTVCDEQLQEALCPKDLYSTYQSMLMKAGRPEEEVPMEELIAAEKVGQIQKRIETKLWTGLTVSGDCFNGLSYLISTGQTGVANSSGTAFDNTKAYGTAGNPITEVDGLINALDDDAMSRDDLVVFMSHANFRLYVQALTKANFFQNYIGNAEITGNLEATHPNTNVKVIPTIGLNGKNQVVVGPTGYMFYGVDLESDNEKMDIWWSKDNNELRIQANFTYGVAIKGWSDIDYFATNNLA